jgi:2-hydroxycyclohexanecarboxyl-CoA dehydrogenase
MTGRVAVVTGGASGIGLATVRAFAQEGANVVIWDRSSESNTVCSELQAEFPSSVRAHQVDVADESQVANATAATMKEFGRIDHLVHCVAIGSGKFGFPFLKLTPADWPRVLQVNIMGMVHVAHHIAPVMVSQRGGTMVFLSSVAGQIGSQTDPPYSASKAANINFAQCMAKDLAPHGVRVNTVCPGMVQTPLNRSVWQAWYDQASEAERLDYDTWSAQKIASIVPLGKWQLPSDIANMNYFLSSRKGAQITGQTINVDGGYVMHW